jgi:superfamily II DNA or RNA helicase
VVKLTILPTHLSIQADSKSNGLLSEHFTYDVPSAKHIKRQHEKYHPKPVASCWKCQWNGTTCLFRYGKLPIGFLQEVYDLLDENGIEYTVTDSRQTPEKQFDWHHDFDMRAYQQELIDTMLAEGSGIIESPTGSGKTVLAAVAVCELGLPTAIVVPTKVIHNQFVSTFKEHSDIPIGVIASGKYEDSPVQICICKSLLVDGKPHPALKNKQVLICDEAHQSASKQWEAVVAGCDAYHRFGFSATPFRANDLECALLQGIAGNVIATVETTDLQDEGFLCQTDIRMIPVPVEYDRTIFDERIPEGHDEPIGWRDTNYAERYRQGIVENVQRNLDIAEVVLHHHEQGDKVLVIVSWTDHAELLLPVLPEDTIYLSGKDTSKKTKEKVDEYKGKSGGVLLGSPVVDVGFDVPSCDVVVMAGAGSYEGRQRQRLGRGLRPSPGKESVRVIDFVDDDRQNGGRPMFYQHSRARVKAYESVGQEVTWCKDVQDALRSRLTLGV